MAIFGLNSFFLDLVSGRGKTGLSWVVLSWVAFTPPLVLTTSATQGALASHGSKGVPAACEERVQLVT
jgi:hypothetical protein